MKKVHFEIETDGFYGVYWKCKSKRDAAMILMLGDDPEDFMAISGVRWLHGIGINVMSMSPGKKDYGHQKNWHCGSFHNRNACFDSGILF